MYSQQNPQPQSYHTSSYVGSQPGHDASFRSDSQQPSTYFAGQQVTSQYRGKQNTFQPTNLAQFSGAQTFQNQQLQNQQSIRSSFVNQNQFQPTQASQYPKNQFQSNQFQPQFQQVSQVSNPSQNQYQSQFQNQAQNQPSPSPQFSFSQFQPQSQFINNLNNQIQSQQQSPESYHMSSYKGSQANHDQYLRSDSNSASSYNKQNSYMF